MKWCRNRKTKDLYLNQLNERIEVQKQNVNYFALQPMSVLAGMGNYEKWAVSLVSLQQCIIVFLCVYLSFSISAILIDFCLFT